MLSCYEFGRELLKRNDLDPVYVLLHEAQLDLERLERWLLGYWCFYHVGTASWVTSVTNEPAYWLRMRMAAADKQYPRCHERRHFRGELASKSVEWLARRGVRELFRPLRLSQAYPLSEVMEYVKTWVGFGPWIAFKVADMLECLGLCRVVFDTGAMSLFDSPRKGAALLWATEHRGRPPVKGEVEGWAVNRILDELSLIDGKPPFAPPRYERPLNCQEAETILCKWKSYRGGHYQIGEDVTGCKRGLLRFPHYSLSQDLHRAGRRSGLW